MRFDDALETTSVETDRLARLVADADADLTVEVPACPGWTARDVVEHLGGVHRWSAAAVGAEQRPGEFDRTPPPDDATGLASWLRTGAAALVAALTAAGPDGPAWHPFPGEQSAAIWARRQAMETMIHRWDVDDAVTGDGRLDLTGALVGVQEYVDLALPRIFARERLAPPAPSLHLHCTDDGLPVGDEPWATGEWILWSEDGAYRWANEHRKGDAAARGRAEDLLLVFMGRRGPGAVDVVGDPAAAAAWFDLPGL